jgi:hypothetical protein
MGIFKRLLGASEQENEKLKFKSCEVCGRVNPVATRFCSSCGAEFTVVHDHYDAFLSYRRESGSDLASLLKVQLETRFNKRIFLDVKELQVGNFDEALLHRIEETTNFILILSRGSLDRCSTKSDWLKREILHAIKTSRNIIPVLTNGFSFPSNDEWKLLPSEMQILSSLNGVIYNHIHQDSAFSQIAKYMKADAKMTGQVIIRTPKEQQPSESEDKPAIPDIDKIKISDKPPKKSDEKVKSETITPDNSNKIASSAPTLLQPVSHKKMDPITIFSIPNQNEMTTFPDLQPRIGGVILEVLEAIPDNGQSFHPTSICSVSVTVLGLDSSLSSTRNRPSFGNVSILKI